ncbi:glycerophosphodiester phosphodiesterase [Streptomyces sp. NPDC002248]
MPRYLFGSIADYVISPGDDNAATLQAGATVTAWSDAFGGTQYLDLLQTDAATPIAEGKLVTDARGAVPEFYGPDSVAALYLDANGGEGPRRRTVATDLGTTVADTQAALATHTAAVNPHGTSTWALADQTAYPSVDAFLAGTPFVAAHRGSGQEFPEHTLASYESALAAGARAIEVSVNVTADGVPVCIHDTTLDRTTDHTGPVSAWTYAALREQVRAKPQSLLGAGWADQRLPALRDVLDRLYGRCVIFLEPKNSAAVQPILDLLDQRFPGGSHSIIYKGYYTDGSFAGVRARGYKVWAYVDAGTTDAQMDAVQANVDIWGVPTGMTDARITAVVGRGKPVMSWEVHSFTDRDRLLGLGVRGLMEARWVYLNKPRIASYSAALTARVIPPGMLTPQHYSAAWAPKIDTDGAFHLDQLSGYSICMGGMRAASADTYTVAVSMRWDTLPASTLHSDIVVGKASDDPFQFSAPTNASGGYHVLVRASGDLQVYRHDPHVTSGVALGSVSTPAPVAGTPVRIEVQVSPTQIIARRVDLGTTYTVTANDTTYRGPFWHLSNGSVTSQATVPRWSNPAVS